jgi:pimeloyl-ACP methyl ester carboxylesterase
LPGYKDAWLSILEQFVGPFGGRKGMALDSEYLGGIQQPTMFIWGEDDAFGGAEIGQKAVDAMPNASLTTMPGGHLPWLDDPESVGAQVQSWLSKSRADS